MLSARMVPLSFFGRTASVDSKPIIRLSLNFNSTSSNKTMVDEEEAEEVSFIAKHGIGEQQKKAHRELPPASQTVHSSGLSEVFPGQPCASSWSM
jgi:hypothetical protein